MFKSTWPMDLEKIEMFFGHPLLYGSFGLADVETTECAFPGRQVTVEPSDGEGGNLLLHTSIFCTPEPAPNGPPKTLDMLLTTTYTKTPTPQGIQASDHAASLRYFSRGSTGPLSTLTVERSCSRVSAATATACEVAPAAGKNRSLIEAETGGWEVKFGEADISALKVDYFPHNEPKVLLKTSPYYAMNGGP